MTDRVGQQLGNYRLTRLLGHGGFADVYLGEHVFLKTQAAIKVLHSQLTPDTIENFLSEAQTIARLVHPHIVRVLDFGVENTIPFLVMEYAPNGTLRQRHLRGTVLPLPLIVFYIKQIAEALQYAHDQRLVHRDVKPENMLLGRTNEVLLSDFGIATIAHTSRSLNTVDISGTISYMAPEQVQGKSRPASDQYSLGIIAYEWMTGNCPFQGSFTEIASQQMFATPPPIRKSYPAIPPEVEEVLMMALAKNPDARFVRVEAFANALQQASGPAQSVPSDAIPTYISPSPAAPFNTGPTYIPSLAVHQNLPPVTPLPPVLTPPAYLPETTMVSPMADRPQQGISRRAVIGGLFGLAAVAAGGTALYVITHPQSPVNVTPTPTPVSSPTPQPTPVPSPQSITPVTNGSLIYLGPYQEISVAWSIDGRRIVSAGNGSIIEVWDSTTKNLIFNMNSGSTVVYSVAWSPDGRRIVSGHHDGTVKIWDAANGSLIYTLTGHTYQVNSVAWSHDSTKVVSGSGDKTARVWDATTGSYLFAYSGHTHYINALAWSHDRSRIVSGSGDNTAQVWDANAGTSISTPITTYNKHSGQILALAWSKDDARVATASDDNTAQVWDANTANNLITYRGHSDFVVALSWSPDGSRIVTGGGNHNKVFSDTSVQVWDATSGTKLSTYSGHKSEVEGVAWSPDSRRVASASDDMTVQVWQVP